MALVYASVRAWLTADRLEFVHDGDPRAAFLAYPVGAQVTDDHAEAYLDFVAQEHPDTGQPVDPGATAQYRVWRTAKGDLVHDGDPAAQAVAYEAGQALAAGDRATYEALGAPPVKMAAPPANKMRRPAANKAATPAQSPDGQ